MASVPFVPYLEHTGPDNKRSSRESPAGVCRSASDHHSNSKQLTTLRIKQKSNYKTSPFLDLGSYCFTAAASGNVSLQGQGDI